MTKASGLAAPFGQMQDAEQSGILASEKEGCLGHAI